MKSYWSSGLLIIASILAGVLLWRTAGTNSPKVSVPPPAAPETATNTVRRYPSSFTNTKRAAEYSSAEREELEKRFNAKFKPAIENWCKAYGRHIRFRPEEVTFDQFHSRLAGGLYTFMVGRDTLTIRDRNNEPAKVVYMTADGSLKTLNSIPNHGETPSLALPIAREEVIQMVKQDCGVEFKLNECIITPTGQYSAMSGGADIHMLPTGADPNNGLSSKIDMVFDAEGRLVYYDRDPLF